MKRKKTGFTLLELIIAMAITIIVLGIAGSMITTGNKVFNDSDVKSTLQIEGQEIQEKISDIGMQGKDLKIADDGSLIIESYAKDDGTNPRYFKTKKENKELKIYRYTNESCSISSLESDKTQTISDDVDSLNISSANDAKSINVDIVLKKTQGFSVDVTHEVNFTITLRNKNN